MANSERTLIAIKPDGVQRGLVGEIIKRFEQKCLPCWSEIHAGFRGPSQGALHRPEGPSLLYWPCQIHTLRTIGCYGLGGAECCEDRPGDAWRDQPCRL
ncbi:Nucleoside diphosphate kinase A [Lemmus lemmus]